MRVSNEIDVRCHDQVMDAKSISDSNTKEFVDSCGLWSIRR